MMRRRLELTAAWPLERRRLEFNLPANDSIKWAPQNSECQGSGSFPGCGNVSMSQDGGILRLQRTEALSALRTSLNLPLCLLIWLFMCTLSIKMVIVSIELARVLWMLPGNYWNKEVGSPEIVAGCAEVEAGWALLLVAGVWSQGILVGNLTLELMGSDVNPG